MSQTLSELLNHALDEGSCVLFEGAQGTMLDIDHGTYPFVTSSSATSGGAATGCGVSPTRFTGVVGVTKAYTTRVGGGPFPTEMPDLEAKEVRSRGNEYGAVTGRPRRCGWLDLVMLRYAVMINGINSLIVTKLDVFDTQKRNSSLHGLQIQRNTGAARNAGGSRMFLRRSNRCIGRYRVGRAPRIGVRDADKLPTAAKDYLKFISRFSRR